MSKPIPLLLSAALMLTGCTSITPTPEIRRFPPHSLTAPCPDLPPAREGRLSTILLNSLDRAELYYDCQARHQGLADWASGNHDDRR